MDIDRKRLCGPAAMCTHIGDQVPETMLISKSGTWERAQHDRLTYFGMTKMEALKELGVHLNTVDVAASVR